MSLYPPERLSDETAYCLSEFLRQLSQQFETCYYYNIKRYFDKIEKIKRENFLQQQFPALKLCDDEQSAESDPF